ncbi:unnamed protein product [Zymoseptoria tritici ST99CH_3D1]|uniref:Uncharacterized protein n=1 Tax=Zymoseptoria tritici ST99CH_1E4 TaxID=1276532 RepID=A0A2H1H584_ZYMTR|nr:unnamed protein product [Zymoseptoria tritici ST99CH_1E4]SMR64104.1 unnamed protein product [Zymoseptoria tritici ST99CH_3D1]
MAAQGESPYKKQRRFSPSITFTSSTMSLLTSNDTTKAKSASYKLMPQQQQVDPTALTTSIKIRRNIKLGIFGDNELDWKSIPTWHENGRPWWILNRMPHLRCESDPAYFATILESFRLQKPAMASSTSSNSDTIIVDGEEMVDMIG